MSIPILSPASLTARHPTLARHFTDPWEGGPPPHGGGPLIHDYIATGGLLVDAAARRDLRQNLALLGAKAAARRAEGGSRQAERIAFVVRFFTGSGAAWPRGAALCRSVNEAAFALIHLIAGADLIPVDLPRDGFADDGALLTALLTRNERVLRDFARQTGAEWAGLLPGKSHAPAA